MSLQEKLGSALWYPGQSDQEWRAAVRDAYERQFIIDEFLKGNVETDSFLDWVAETFEDPFRVFQDLPQPTGILWNVSA